MTLKHICTGVCVVVIIFSVVNSSRDKEDISPDIAQIQDNVSAVKSLINKVIKNYNKLDKLAASDVEYDDNTDSEKKQHMDEGNKGRIIFRVTTDNHILMLNRKPPLLFSFSGKLKKGEIKEKKTIEISKENDNFRNLETDSKDTTDTQIKLRNVEDDNDHKDERSSEFEDNHYKENYSGEPYSKQKVLIVHVGKGKSNQRENPTSTARQKYLSSNIPKKDFTKKITKSEEVIQNSHSEEDKAMESEIKKANYLRQAYADACHQVVVRKCLRALRAALNDVCSRSRKCTSKYKEDFREFGHEGCNEQFGDQKSTCRMGLDIDEDTESEKQERARHLDSKKQERQETVVEEVNWKRSIKGKKTPEHAEIHEVNILRDRFEKLCKKSSYTKCRAACKHASDKTCEQHECVSAKKKALKKSCKTRCQETYAYKGGSDESEDEDRDTDSDESE
ncbi:uncharacterized protein LOC134675727 [Cydia fagiglandana]|uniref:uncharacterized protein LOC134675727 n=1 Tax=Cydia fagiglandana TaxID=1458189 RepID=UPI002FEDE62F